MYRTVLHPIRGDSKLHTIRYALNTLNAELNPICHLLALLGAHPTLHVSRIRINAQQFQLSY
jgi:hypothetical protein